MQNDSANALRHPTCILGACCLPWNEDYTLAESVFRNSVRKLLGGLTRHLYVFGTAGEGHAVTRAQFDRVCRLVSPLKTSSQAMRSLLRKTESN